jgi:excisionase family DNA binding protein
MTAEEQADGRIDLADLPEEFPSPPDSLQWHFCSDLASVLEVHPSTVRRWIRRGWLRARRMGLPGSRWRVQDRDLEPAFMKLALRSDKRMLRSWLKRLRRTLAEPPVLGVVVLESGGTSRAP